MSTRRKYLTIALSVFALITVLFLYLGAIKGVFLHEFFVTLGSKSWYKVYINFSLLILVATDILLLVRTIIAPSAKDFLLQKEKDGSVGISLRALESQIRQTLCKHNEVSDCKAKIAVKGWRKPQIYITCDLKLKENVNIAEVGSVIRKEISSSVGAFTGTPIAEVEIRYVDLAPADK